MIKVSVLTPIYNHKIDYVRECLDSLHAQTLKGCEFILIDNEATDEAKKLIAEYCKKDKRFKCVYISKNKGYGYAMNKGLKEAVGEYIGIVESDDFIHPDMYKILYQIGHENNVDLVKCLFAFKQENQPLKIGISFKPNEYNKVLKNLDVRDFVFKYGSYWSAIYKKEMLTRHQILFEEQPKPSGEDIMFTLKTYFFCRNLWISHRCLYNYRQDNPNSSIRGKDERIENCMNLYLKLNTYLESKRYEMLDDYWYIKSRREFLNFWWAYKSGCITKTPLILKISKQLKHNIIQGHVHLGPVEMSLYNKIAYHPLWMIFVDSILKTKKTPEKECIAFCGIPIKTKQNLKGKKIIRYLGGLIKTIQTEKKTKKYFMGIRFYKKIIPVAVPVSVVNNVPDYRSLIQRMEYDIKACLYAQNLHPQTFSKFLNCHLDEDVVLVACGPSVSYFTPIKSAKYVGVNRSFLNKNVSLDYLFVQDNLGENMQEANQYRSDLCQKFYGIIPHFRNMECRTIKELQHIHRISLSDAYKANAKQYILHEGDVPYWPYDISKEPLIDSGGTIFSALQFVCYTHPKRIYLVGCDCSDGGHFYGGREEKFSAQIRWWKDFKNYLVENFSDIEVISVNPIGLRGMFKDVYTKNFLKDHPELVVDKEQIL